MKSHIELNRRGVGDHVEILIDTIDFERNQIRSDYIEKLSTKRRWFGLLPPYSHEEAVGHAVMIDEHGVRENDIFTRDWTTYRSRTYNFAQAVHAACYFDPDYIAGSIFLTIEDIHRLRLSN